MRVTREALNRDPRLAGDLVRYHTHPTIQQQTVAAHTWHAMRIYLELWGPMPPAVSTLLLLHDVGEAGGGPGDISWGSKRRRPELKALADEMEREQLGQLGYSGAIAAAELVSTKTDHRRIKLCDLLEMMEFSHKECMLGSRYGELVFVDMRDAALKLSAGTEDDEAVLKFIKSTTERYA